MVDALARVIAGDVDPRCELCGGILKSDTILFGQPLEPDVIGSALAASEECEVLLAVGTSLSVYPAANAVPRAKAAGAALIIVNGQPTEMDNRADVVINAGISDVLPLLCKSI
jgi:NAD-dependent deacetylase